MLDPKLRDTVLELERYYTALPPATAINQLCVRLVTAAYQLEQARAELDTMREVTQGNKRHVAVLTAIIERVQPLAEALQRIDDAHHRHGNAHGQYNGYGRLLLEALNQPQSAGLGSSRRAQDAEAEAVERYEGALASGLSDAEAREEGWPSRPVPSQGQEIPADQLQALIAEATHIPQTDAYRHLAVAGYRVGYAAALGYEITIDDGWRVGVGDRPEPSQPPHSGATDALRAALADAEHYRRDLLNERHEHRQTSAAEDEARERAERLATALDRANRILHVLGARSRYGVALTGYHGRIVVFGFPVEQTALDTGRALADALANHQGVRVDATLIEPARLGDPPVVDVQALLEETRRALAAADSDQDRADIIEDLLQEWYLAWPETAYTSPHQAIAGELIRLLTGQRCPFCKRWRELQAMMVPEEAVAAPERPVDLIDRVPQPDVWAGLKQRVDDKPTTGWQVVILDNSGFESDVDYVFPHVYATEVEARRQVEVLEIAMPPNRNAVAAQWSVRPAAPVAADEPEGEH